MEETSSTHINQDPEKDINTWQSLQPQEEITQFLKKMSLRNSRTKNNK